jgi:ABC-type branched-subunit amino acid transport system ATPase component/branched-subunit amino acid ABC-type transport system permease component
MTSVLQFAVLGLGAGTAYALLSQGLLLVYRGSGVLNFSQAALGMFGAFLFWQWHAKDGIAFGPAFILAIAASAVLGVVVFQGLMRPLRAASRLSQVVITLGVLLFLQGICQLIWGTLTVNIKSFLPSTLWHVAGVAVGESNILLLIIAVAITAALAWGSRTTAVGLAIRGNAENSRAVSTLGWSPNALGTLTWGLGAALAAVAGIFIAPLNGIDTVNMPLLVIPVLAAVLIGRLSSFWLTLAGALVIGIAQSLVARYVTGIPGAVQATPFVIILVLLIARGQGLPSRSQIAQRLPALGTGQVRPLLVIPTVAIGFVLLNWVLGQNLVIAIGVSLSWAIVLLSVNVLLGYTGQLSLAQFALGGVAALMAGRLVAAGDLTFVPAFIVAVAGTVVAGLLLALPALRARGINLAVVTLGLGVSVSALLFTNGTLTGGFDGTNVGAQSLFGLSLDTITYPKRWTIFVFVIFVICALIVANVRRGATGRRLIAVRTNERAASALGLNVLGIKLYAFGFAAMLAAVGGILVAFQNSTILYTQFDPIESVLVIVYAFIGSIGFVIGAPIGSTLVAGGFGGWILNELFPSASASWLIVISGVFVMALALLNPDGIVSANVAQLQALRRRIRRVAIREPLGHAPLPEIKREPVKPLRLTVEDIVVRFGGVVAVNGAKLEVGPGKIVGLIGPNGAGKTTLIDTITGFVSPASGDVKLDGESIRRWTVHRRTRAGLSRSFQSLELFESSTVRENLSVASDVHSLSCYATDVVRPRAIALSAAAVTAVREFELEGHLDRRVSELSYGQRRLVAIARSIATSPSILLLDEPAAGLSSHETQELAKTVRRLANDWGFGILVIEHDIGFVMGVCDEIAVLDFGRQIAYGPPQEIRHDRAVISAYLGEVSQAESSSASSHVTVPAGPADAVDHPVDPSASHPQILKG